MASSCTSPSTSADGLDGSAEPDSWVAEGAPSEGADAPGADVQTADVPIVDLQPTDAGTVDAWTADVQTADVQASPDACVLDDAGTSGTRRCGNGPNEAGLVSNDAGNLVRPPGGGLVGNSNYFIAAFPPGKTGSPIMGLDMSIAVAEDIPVPHHSISS